jgi:hypothetical protein
METVICVVQFNIWCKWLCHNVGWQYYARKIRRGGYGEYLYSKSERGFSFPTNHLPLEHSASWEANSSSLGLEIPRILWNPKLHCCTYKRPVLLRSLSQSNPFCLLPSYFFKIRFNILIPFTPWSLMRYLFFRFHLQNFVCIFSRLP